MGDKTQLGSTASMDRWAAQSEKGAFAVAAAGPLKSSASGAMPPLSLLVIFPLVPKERNVGEGVWLSP